MKYEILLHLDELLLFHLPLHNLFAVVCEHVINDAFLWDFILSAILEILYLSAPYNVPDGLIANTTKNDLQIGKGEQVRIIR